MYTGLLVGSGGATPVVAVALITMDGTGAITGGRTVWNVPQGFDARANQEIPIASGSYEVEADGKGSVLTPDLGIPSWHMVVVRVEPQATGVPLAQELYWAGDTIEPFGANIVTATLKRLPDEATFSAASIEGLYTRNLQGHGGLASVAGIGTIAVDGLGNGVGQGPVIVNAPGLVLGQRQLVPIPTDGPFTVFADGIATFVDAAQPDFGGVLVITGTQLRDDGVFVATEAVFMLDQLFPLVGSLVTGNISRQLAVN
jgi:hypothetical protein